MYSKQLSLVCPRCGSDNERESVFCGHCGLKFPTNENSYINAIFKSCQDSITKRYQNEREASLFEIKASHLKNELESLQSDIADSKIERLELFAEVDRLTAENTIRDLGFHKPRYAFESSEIYRARLENIREKQKSLIRNKEAAVCTAEWTVNGSYVKGRRQTNDNLKLMLFAFNGESDVLIAKVKFNNVKESEARIKKVFELVNKTGTVQSSAITEEYLDLKIQELHLAHEYQEKIQAEKEEQRRIREEIRQEELARREFEKARIDAEKEENKYEKQLEKVREESLQANADQQEKFLAQIALLEQRLAEAQANKERAISRAQQTRSGHVYVISNIGSFGENVYKIGMTRRLEPMDRVRELGDASVPFLFDVHAIIFSEDAPRLENALHRKFSHLRLNQVNGRKEFFRVSLDEIAKVVREEHGEIEFTNIAEAADYYKTQSIFLEGQDTNFDYDDNLLEIGLEEDE